MRNEPRNILVFSSRACTWHRAATFTYFHRWLASCDGSKPIAAALPSCTHRPAFRHESSRSRFQVDQPRRRCSRAPEEPWHICGTQACLNAKESIRQSHRWGTVRSTESSVHDGIESGRKRFSTVLSEHSRKSASNSLLRQRRIQSSHDNNKDKISFNRRR